MSLEADLFRRIMGSFASGVTVVTTMDGEAPRGFTASAVTSLSIDPTLLLVCAHSKSTTLAAIRESGAFVVNILASGQQSIAQRFATRGEAKFDGLIWRPGVAGMPVLGGVLAYAECKVRETLPGGDHTIIIGEPIAGAASDAVPLLYFRGRYGAYQGGIASVLGSAEDWEVW